MINIPLIVRNFLVLFGYNFNKPARLDPPVHKSKFDNICEKIAPYVIFFAILILCALITTIIIKYGGSWFGTEANTYERMGQII